jgi:hypothetical protein
MARTLDKTRHLNLHEMGVRAIDAVLHCPVCRMQHIDAPDGDWTNPSHRSHLCAGCGCIWRTADTPTNGVAAVATRGAADTWPLDRAAEPTGEIA